jgi:hypothetical protein
VPQAVAQLRYSHDQGCQMFSPTYWHSAALHDGLADCITV